MSAELIGTGSDMGAVIEAARIGESVTVGETHLAFPLPEGGHVEMVDVERAVTPYLPNPRRKTGAYRVHDAASFAAYLHQQGTPDTEVWADAQGARIVGVINAHGEVLAGWGDHRVTYAVEQTKAWQIWMAKVNARFRYRITDGTLRVGYRLTRPDDVLREAFESVVTEVAGLDGTPDVIFRGVPAG